MPASRSARAMIFAPRSCPSSPGFATTTLIFPPGMRRSLFAFGRDDRGRRQPRADEPGAAGLAEVEPEGGSSRTGAGARHERHVNLRPVGERSDDAVAHVCL